MVGDGDNPYVPSKEQQQKIIDHLERIDEEYVAAERYRRKNALINDLQLNPAEIPGNDLLDELKTQMNLSKWYDIESDEQYEARPDDIQSLYESGLSKKQLEMLGFDTSVL